MSKVLFVVLAFAVVALDFDLAHPARADDDYFKGFAGEVDNLITVFEIEKDVDEKQRGEFIRLRRRITSDLRSLNERIAAKKSEPSEEYRDSIMQGQEALKLVRDRDLKIDERIDLCRAVAKDIEVKEAMARKNPDDASGLVKVTVRTRNREEEASGFEVWFVSQAWLRKSNRHKRFDMNSSPTDRKMAPGAYWMWTKSPGRDNEGKKKPVSVGESGDLQQVIDLPVPE